MVATQDDTTLVYDDISGQVTEETTKLTKNKDVVKNYTYDSAGKKSAFAVKVGDDTKLSLQYRYDGESKLTSVTDEQGNQVAGYDYDMDGNLSERTVAGNNLTTTYAYDYQNHLTSKYNKNDELLRTDTLNTDTEEDSVVIYKNDKNGNQLAAVNRYEIPSEKKDQTYIDIDVTLGDNRLNENVVNHYNALNQLTQTLTKNYKVSFTYDAEGLRTSKTVNGEKRVFVWDGDQLVMELSESGKVQKRYIRGNDLVYADQGADTEKQYYVIDPHGNVVQLTDENGKVTKTYEYDSFGNEVNPDSKDDNPFRYCGEYYDKETEEIYLRARYYQPAVGRFLTRDTYTGEEDEPLSLHLYTYCGNDGVNAWDPSGHTYGYAYRGSNGEIHREGFEWISKKKGKVLKTKVKFLRVCTDGKITKQMENNNLYNDEDHGEENTTACFGKHISADQIPYIVVPPSKAAYKFSVGVIIDTSNNNYLYCVVAEVGPDDNGMGEVSIYAAWKMKNLGIPKNSNQVKDDHMIGNIDQEAPKEWKIILFKKSAPEPKKSKKKYGWKYKAKASKFRKQIKKVGSKCYTGIGKCLD